MVHIVLVVERKGVADPSGRLQGRAGKRKGRFNRRRDVPVPNKSICGGALKGARGVASRYWCRNVVENVGKGAKGILGVVVESGRRVGRRSIIRRVI